MTKPSPNWRWPKARQTATAAHCRSAAGPQGPAPCPHRITPFMESQTMSESLPTKVFNTEKTDYDFPEIILGQDVGLFDTINKFYPEIWKLYKTLKNQDWDENEFDYAPCNVQFKTCDKHTYDMMIKTLAWRWE